MYGASWACAGLRVAGSAALGWGLTDECAAGPLGLAGGLNGSRRDPCSEPGTWRLAVGSAPLRINYFVRPHAERPKVRGAQPPRSSGAEEFQGGAPAQDASPLAQLGVG